MQLTGALAQAASVTPRTLCQQSRLRVSFITTRVDGNREQEHIVVMKSYRSGRLRDGHEYDEGKAEKCHDHY